MAGFVLEDSYNINIINQYPILEQLGARLIRKCTERGFNISNDTAIDEILDAISAVNERRRFVSTETQLVESKYEGLVLRLCIASIAKYGAEGQSSHSENGIGRGYENGSNYPKSLLQEIVPLAGSPSVK